MNDEEEFVVRIIIAIIGLIVAWEVSNYAYTNFISTGVTPDIAAGCSIALFALVLGAFGLIAVKVNL